MDFLTPILLQIILLLMRGKNLYFLHLNFLAYKFLTYFYNINSIIQMHKIFQKYFHKTIFLHILLYLFNTNMYLFTANSLLILYWYCVAGKNVLKTGAVMKICRTETGVPENQTILTDPSSDRVDYINDVKALLGIHWILSVFITVTNS